MEPRANNHQGSQHGVVMIEFIIILPLLLCIAGVTVEMARFLRFNQMASVLSQEAALRAYRQCSDFFVYSQANLFALEATRATTKRCLEEVGAQLVASRNNLEARTPSISFNMAISVYRQDENEGFDNERILWASASRNPDLPNLANSQLRQNFSPPLAVRRRVVVAEVSYNYEPVIGLYQGFWQGLAAAFRRQGNVFIETTII